VFGGGNNKKQWNHKGFAESDSSSDEDDETLYNLDEKADRIDPELDEEISETLSSAASMD